MFTSIRHGFFILLLCNLETLWAAPPLGSSDVSQNPGLKKLALCAQRRIAAQQDSGEVFQRGCLESMRWALQQGEVEWLSGEEKKVRSTRTDQRTRETTDPQVLFALLRKACKARAAGKRGGPRYFTFPQLSVRFKGASSGVRVAQTLTEDGLQLTIDFQGRLHATNRPRFKLETVVSRLAPSGVAVESVAQSRFVSADPDILLPLDLRNKLVKDR